MSPLLKVVKTFTNKIFGIKEVEEVQVTIFKTRAQLIEEGRGSFVARKRTRK